MRAVKHRYLWMLLGSALTIVTLSLTAAAAERDRKMHQLFAPIR